MSKRSTVVFVAVSALLLFAVGGYIYSTVRLLQAPAPAQAVQESSLVRQHSPVIGKADARVTIVEFLDPSCEGCRAFYPIVKDVLAKNPDDVKLVIRYAAFHEGSEEAVRIVEAARLQGKFEQVLEALFNGQDEWAAHSGQDLKRAWDIARDAGLELMQARLDSVKPEIDAVLKQDAADVTTNKVEQTPTFFVNGAPLTQFSEEGFRMLVQQQLDATANGT